MLFLMGNALWFLLKPQLYMYQLQRAHFLFLELCNKISGRLNPIHPLCLTLISNDQFHPQNKIEEHIWHFLWRYMELHFPCWCEKIHTDHWHCFVSKLTFCNRDQEIWKKNSKYFVSKKNNNLNNEILIKQSCFVVFYHEWKIPQFNFSSHQNLSTYYIAFFFKWDGKV